jgi:uncharacterized protein HemX
MTSPEPGYSSQPLPDAGSWAYAGAQQPAPPPPSPPKRTAVVVLTIAAVLMLGAAATLGTLWFIEQGDHKKTTEQLSTRDEQLATRDTELADEKKAHDGTKSKLGDAEKAKTDAEGKVTELTSCAAAGKELARLAIANASDAEGEKAFDTLVLECFN